MINRSNYLTVQRYLEHRRRVVQSDEKTVARAWICCKHVLKWLDNKPLCNAPSVIPALPEYLLTARDDGKDVTLHPATMTKILSFARDLFEFAKRENPREYKQITDYWLDTLRVKRSVIGSSRRLDRHAFWSLEDIRTVLAVDVEGLRYERDKAALAFLFISGMRGGAFVTLPVEAVDLERRRISQLPELGVKTKNSKAAITFLLPIPDLLRMVTAWHKRVVRAGSGRRAWYAKLDNTGEKLAQVDEVGTYALSGRRSALYQGLKELCDLAEVEFKSPHKIRHGHGVYGVKHAKDMAQLKAVSQNMMHANIGITDGIYGRLPEEDIANILAEFTE